MRGPARSIRAGATHRSVPVLSRAQESSRSRTLSICAQFTTATVSARKWCTAAVTLSIPPDTGTPAISARRRRPPGTHAATMDRPCELSRPSAVISLCHRARGPDHHGPAGTDPEAALAVQPLAERVPREHVEGGQRGQGQHHVATGQVQLRGVGEDGDAGRQAHARAQDPVELVGPGAHDAAVVPAGQRDGGPPEQRQGERERQVHVRRIDPGVVPDLVRGHPGQQGAGHIDAWPPA